MKILYFTNKPAPYRVKFFNKLSEKNDLTVVFDSVKEDRNPNWYKDNIYNFKTFFLKHRVDFFGINSILKNKYDVYVIGTYASPNGALLSMLFKLKKIKFFINADGGFVAYNESKLSKFVKTFFISKASYYLSTGEGTNKYLSYYGADRENIFIYPFSSLEDIDVLDNPVSYSDKMKMRREKGFNYKRLFVTVGSFIDRKGFDLILEACSLNNFSDIGFLIIGGGEKKDVYERFINEHNLKNIHLIDFCPKDEVFNFYKMSDCFVFPSREDIWGLVINEAMGCGLPVISSDNVLASLELLDKKYIFKVNDISSLSKKIKWISKMTDNALKKIGQENIDIIKKYTIENMADEHLNIFDSVVHHK